MKTRWIAWSFVLALAALLSLLNTSRARAQAPESDALNVEAIAHHGGFLRAVALQGNYAYLGVGNSLHIVDVSDSAHPSLVGQSPPLHNRIYDLAVSGSHAFVLSGYYLPTLHIFDISDPSAPVEVGFYADLPEYAATITLAGNHLYIAGGSYYRGGPLQILDVTNPADPVQVALDSRTAQKVTIVGHLAYVASGDVLRVLDVTNPANPVWLGYYDTPGYAVDVAVVGDYAYVVDLGQSMRVIDVSDPSTPVEVGFLDISAQGVVASGSHLYLISPENYDAEPNLYIVDIAVPERPMLAGTHSVEGMSTDLAVSGNHAFLSTISMNMPGSYIPTRFTGGGLHIIDVAAPGTPATVSTYEQLQRASQITLVGDYAYVSDEGWTWNIVNLSDPTRPVEVGQLAPSWAPLRITVRGDYAFVAAGQDGLRILDVRNPAAPVEVGSFATAGRFAQAQDVALIGDYAYVATRVFNADPENYLNEGGFYVVDVSNPAAPREVTFERTAGGAPFITALDHYVYLSVWDGNDGLTHVPGGLRVYNVSAPADPVQVGFLADQGGKPIFLGNYAYITGGDLNILDVSDPTKPLLVAEQEVPSSALAVAVNDGFAYVSADFGGFYVYDVSNPTAPREVGHYDLDSRTLDVALLGDYALVTNAEGGLFVLRNVLPVPSALTVSRFEAEHLPAAPLGVLFVLMLLVPVALLRARQEHHNG